METLELRSLPGIGPVKARLFAKLGITQVDQLLFYLPRSYEDRTVFVPIAELQPGNPACFVATVVSEVRTTHLRKGLDLTRLNVADDTGLVHLTFFNQSYTAGAMERGRAYVFYGALETDGGSGMTNPVFEASDTPPRLTRRVLPIYPATDGLSSNQIGRTVSQALDLLGDTLTETLPQCVCQAYELLSRKAALYAIHQPKSMEELAQARRRLIFEEFFMFSLGVFETRAKREASQGARLSDLDPAPFLAALPFRLTEAQQRAIADIAADLGRGIPMNRLVQGDVGSGKTMVAGAALYLAAKNGLQTALMVPTEILARQQYETLAPLFAKLGLASALLVGSLSEREKRGISEDLALGRIQLVVGTQALLTGRVQFANLGLVVADEQHRFGTAQRAALAAKGSTPHILVMSATPIPRTLALQLYGELEVSILDEKPPGRQEVQTYLVPEAMRQRINAFIRKQVQGGHQVFIVCPAVEESDDLKSVETWAQTLQTLVFPDLRVSLLHGKLPGAEKEAVMAAFARGEADLLVSTTVIEVGVDVPNATLMVIENAERFGLSQLHQLRGRVGRGKDQSYCVLFAQITSPQTLERLKGFAATTDGFAIARQDLELRGPGDFFGARQHGLPGFRMASLITDLELLKQARQAAEGFLAQPQPREDPAWPGLQEQMQELFSEQAAPLN